MRSITIVVFARSSHKESFQRLASDMGFGFFEAASDYHGDGSSVCWMFDVPNHDYKITITDSQIDMESSRTAITQQVDDDSGVVDSVKRFLWDEENASYISKTQNQIEGEFKRMRRLRKLEGFAKGNKILVENPDTQVITIGSGQLRNTQITIYGVGNTLIIEDGFRIRNMELLIRGNNNHVSIGRDFEVNYNTDHGALYLSAKDDGNKVRLGRNVHVRGPAEIVCMEATELQIGDNFGMSNETIIRTGDGHRIIGLDGKRVNPSKSITIGNDCWLARRGVILKGVELGDYTIVGTGALVTKSFRQGNVVLGGNPARVIREGVTWLPGR